MEGVSGEGGKVRKREQGRDGTAGGVWGGVNVDTM